MIALVAQKTTT